MLLMWSISELEKAESFLELLRGFQPKTSELVIQ